MWETKSEAGRSPVVVPQRLDAPAGRDSSGPDSSDLRKGKIISVLLWSLCVEVMPTGEESRL